MRVKVLVPPPSGGDHKETSDRDGEEGKNNGTRAMEKKGRREVAVSLLHE